MLAHRIAKTIESTNTTDSFDFLWRELFPFKYFVYEGIKYNVFDFIFDQTYIRPRDFIIFIKLCCERAIKSKRDINNLILFKSLDSFSKYLLEDIEYEIKPMMIEIKEVLSILQQIRKKVFMFNEFDSKFKLAINKNTLISDKTSEQIMNELYNFNVVGNMTDKGISIFKMYNHINSINFDEQIVIKTGLLVSLGI